MTNLHDTVILVPCQKSAFPSARALEVSPNAIAACLAFRLFLKHNTSDGVAGEGIPYELESMLVPLSVVSVLFEKASGSIRLIDFETLVSTNDL